MSLDAAVQCNLEAVKLAPADHPDRPGLLESLSISFTDRYHRLGDLKDLEAALESDLEAINLIPTDHPNKSQYLYSLGLSFADRYQRLGKIEDLDVAMQRKQEAIELTPTDHPQRAGRVQGLTASFTDQYACFGELKDLEAALKFDREAVDLTAADDPELPLRLKCLATSFADRYHRFGDLQDLAAARLGRIEDLEVAIKTKQKALGLNATDHPDRPEFLLDLAASFGQRYQRLGDLKDLEASIERYQEAVDQTPSDHPSRAERLRGVTVSLGNRYERLGDIGDLTASLKSVVEAVTLIPVDHLDRPQYLHSLAVSLAHRYQRLGDLKDLENSMQRYQEAIDLMPLNHPNRAENLQGLAACFGNRYQRLRDIKDLEAAVQRYQETVDFTPLDHPNRAEHLQGLAISFGDRYKQSGDLNDLETAVKTKLEVVDLTAPDHPARAHRLQALALSLTDRYMRLRDHYDLENVHCYYAFSFTTSSSNDPESSWRGALVWASSSQEFQPSNVPTAYRAAFKILPDILWIGNTIPVRHDAIRRLDIGPITSRATKFCTELGQLKPAVEILEQGLATTFQQILQLKPDADKLLPQQAADLQQLSLQLYSGTAGNPREVAAQRKDLLDDICRQPGLEYSMLPRPYNTLSQAAHWGPVVILNSHTKGCDGIIIINPASELIHVSLPSRNMLKEILERCNVRTRAETAATRLFGHREGFASKTTKECFEEILTWLWKIVVDPVYQVLASYGICQGRLWWLPTGAFAGLPLHASPPRDKFIHSYTATLGSLLEAQNKYPSNTHKFGVIGVTHTGKNYLKGEQATPQAVKLQLQDCSWIHLACHGTQDLVEPTKSRLLLYEGSLKLETILQMPLSEAEFVFLAACQTAMGDAELVNESFHLGGGFIAAGFQSAVGTLVHE
ncbi:CHAT domain-containing protein [Mycena maculata]|uniref:CHAT domain-containing protein n=1 Tax=Mycena maculata TaxID=230809 RepID=A0AAD7J4P1_9AGAR|nr:CHAT domain-containing protein [Mycena maculata]